MTMVLMTRALACLALGSLLAVGSRAESFLLVKIVERDGSERLEVMAPDQVRATQLEMQQEAKLYAKALAQARTGWQKDKENAKPFPANAIHHRSLSPVGSPFDDEAKAAEKRDKMTERDAAKVADEAKKQNLRLRERYPADKRSEKLAELAARESERRALEDKARALYEMELEKIKAGSAPAAGGNPSAP